MGSATNREYVEALQHHQQGNVEAAEFGYREVLKADNGHVGAWHLLGVLLHQRGDHDAAIAHIQTSINFGNRQAACFNNLGAIYLTLAELERAEGEFSRAISINPNFADAHTNLGHVAYRRGELAAAGNSFRKALAINPAHTPALAALGRLLLEESQPQAALEHLRQAVQTQPGDAHAWKTLGHIYIAISEPEKAVEAFRRAHSILPSDADTQFSLGAALDQVGEYEEGERWRMATIAALPQQNWWKLKHALSCPGVVLHSDDITAYASRLNFALNDFANSQPAATVDELAAHDIVLPYAMQGFGLDERAIRSKFALLLEPYVPKFDPVVNREGPPHIGVAVTAGHESIFVRLALPILNRMSAANMRVTIVCPANSCETIRRLGVAEFIEHAAIPARPSLAAAAIQRCCVDVLYYWEIGSDALNGLLPMMRLAPLQCTGYGMQTTSGIPAVDEYISSDLVESPLAADHYTERLVRLPCLLSYQVRHPAANPHRARFGIPENANVYLCVQNPLKVHPEMDEVIGDILRRDALGVVAFPERSRRQHSARLRQRLQASLPQVAHRVLFLPPVVGDDYRTLLATADVHLDTFPYGASTTAYDIFSQHGPLVTLPTEFQRSRYALGCYRRMNFLDLVAATPDDYVNIAVRLGTDRDWREYVRRELAARTPVLFEERNVVQSFQDYFLEAAARARRG